MRIPDTLPIPDHRDMWQTLDSTKLQSFAACPRQYFLEYVLGWRADRQSNHLIFGQAWHAALEHLYQTGLSLKNIPDAYDAFLKTYRSVWPESTDSWFGGKTPEAALTALVEYVDQNASDLYNYSVIATEVTDQLPLNELDSVTVKLDCILQDVKTGEYTILEHKTGSTAGQFWARQWHLSLQVGAYIAACNHFYNQKQTACIVDGVFFLKTKRNFQRELVKKNLAAQINWANSVLALIEGIENNFECLTIDDPDHLTQASFPQNPTACEKYGGCQFYDLCAFQANPLVLAQVGQPPIGFKEEWWNPLAKTEN